jgi:C-terminal processing protease CtpA/Prc
LTTALTSAAADGDEQEFLDTLSRMIAALHDGHGSVVSRSRMGSGFVPPVAWDWVEGQLLVTYVKDAGCGLAAGDAIIAIDGKPIAKAIAERESLISGATPQWIRFRALEEFAMGTSGQPVELEIEPWANPGTRHTVNLKRDSQMGTIREPRPSKITELEPGIFYLDLDKIQDSDFSDALPKLAEAKGIIFDMRGYPHFENPLAFLSHLSESEMTSVQWHLPIVRFPDHKEMEFQRSGEWRISPAVAYLKAKKAFITDGRAISFAESIMGIVENYRLGEIVGGPTAGTNGNINHFTLPGGDTIFWTGMKVLKHDGSRHHGIGILPTIPVSRTRAAIASGRDELLDQAIKTVRQ